MYVKNRLHGDKRFSYNKIPFGSKNENMILQDLELAKEIKLLQKPLQNFKNSPITRVRWDDILYEIESKYHIIWPIKYHTVRQK